MSFLRPDVLWADLLPRLREYYARTSDTTVIAAFTNSQPGTIVDWVTGRRPAVGERLIRLWHFMRVFGFKSPELNKLDPYNQYVGELLAFGVLEMPDVCHVLNVRRPQTAFQILRGQPPMHPTFLLPDLKTMYGDELAAAKSKMQRLEDFPPVPTKADLSLLTADAGEADNQSKVHTAPHPAPPQRLPDDQLALAGNADRGFVLNAAGVVNEALVLLRLVNSLGFAAVDRELFRLVLGEANLVDLADLATALRTPNSSDGDQQA